MSVEQMSVDSLRTTKLAYSEIQFKMQGSAESSGPINGLNFSPLSWVCWVVSPCFLKASHPNCASKCPQPTLQPAFGQT